MPDLGTMPAEARHDYWRERAEQLQKELGEADAMLQCYGFEHDGRKGPLGICDCRICATTTKVRNRYAPLLKKAAPDPAEGVE